MPTLIEEILAPGGAVARRLGERYDFRPQQLEMANAVERALSAPGHLLVEAGTGVGKSFSYLIPAIDYAVKNKKRVIVSTHTISLQEQLIAKDIPLLQAVYPDEFAAVLVKGRSNYICKRRLEHTLSRANSLFEAERQRTSLAVIEDWVERTTDGSLADLPSLPEMDVWDKVCAEQGNCLGKNCKHYKDCHWQAAKRRMQGGKILIVNHALFFSDLALRMAGVNYLPKYDAVILDEAHTIEEVAADHFGLKVSERGLKHQLRRLFDARRGKGLLSTHGGRASDAIRDIEALDPAIENLFSRCIAWQSANGRPNGRIGEPHWVENEVSPMLRNLALHLKAMAASLESPEEASEVNSASEKTAMLGETLAAIITQSMSDAVYWMETSKSGPLNISLNAAPVCVADGLRKHLFAKTPSVILTSATLSTRSPSAGARAALKLATAPAREADGATGAFDYIRSRLGIDKAQELALGSPFDYARQVRLYIESGLPEPNDPLFLSRAGERILHYVKETRGGAFVLFTSHAMLRSAARDLRGEIEAMGLPMLVQGEGLPPRALLEQFRAQSDAVLFGTSSFWQGIDVQGDQLRNVIVVKLPFSAPDGALMEARLDDIKRRGGNPFMDYSVPEAIIRLKQGFGRLIRSRTDQGIVVILDSRVKTKRYGKLFLEALPARETAP